MNRFNMCRFNIVTLNDLLYKYLDNNSRWMRIIKKLQIRKKSDNPVKNWLMTWPDFEQTKSKQLLIIIKGSPFYYLK